MGFFDRKKKEETENNRNDRIKLSNYVSGAVRQFSISFARGDLAYPLLKDIDYTGDVLKEESSFAEQAFAIFMNNLEIDSTGNVLNYKHCEKRAAQYIRSYFDREYIVEPAFETWETELHPVSKEFYMK